MLEQGPRPPVGVLGGFAVRCEEVGEMLTWIRGSEGITLFVWRLRLDQLMEGAIHQVAGIGVGHVLNVHGDPLQEEPAVLLFAKETCFVCAAVVDVIVCALRKT